MNNHLTKFSMDHNRCLCTTVQHLDSLASLCSHKFSVIHFALDTFAYATGRSCCLLASVLVIRLITCITILLVVAGARAHSLCPCTAVGWHTVHLVCMTLSCFALSLRHTAGWFPYDRQQCKGDGKRRVLHCHLESALH